MERDTVTWQAVVKKRCKATANRICYPPGLKINNRFDELSEMVDIGGLEVLMPEKVIGRVGTTERLRSAGKEKVTIDSGAAESVMPKGMLDLELLMEGEAKRMGVKHVAANGAKMENYGGEEDSLQKGMSRWHQRHAVPSDRRRKAVGVGLKDLGQRKHCSFLPQAWRFVHRQQLHWPENSFDGGEGNFRDGR